MARSESYTVAMPLPLEDEAGDLTHAADLFNAADLLRGAVSPSDYKYIVLGLIFLKYVSDAFAERHAWLERAVREERSDYYVPSAGEDDLRAVAEDRDEYLSVNVFWAPPRARWDAVLARAAQPDIGQTIDDAMRAIEAENPQLKGILFKSYAATHVAPHAYYELLNLVGRLGFGDSYARERDVLGRVYEYFIGRFAESEGKAGGEFYTPRSIVKLLVEMLEPLAGRIFDPACGSGGMFVQSARFVEAHHGNPGSISVFGQESLEATWKICRMNLAIRGIPGNIGLGNSFHDDRFKDLRADYVLANPPFNISKWRGNLLRDDARWRYGLPPDNNANYAWIQHFIYHLSPVGRAGFVMANGSMSAGNVEGEMRRQIVEDDLVDCMIALPGSLFYTTSIPVCLWFLARNKAPAGLRDHRGETLFIDARKLFRKVDRTHNELTDAHVARIAATYHAWRGEGSDDGRGVSQTPNSSGVPGSSGTPTGGRGVSQTPGSSAMPGSSGTPDSLETPLPPYADVPGYCRSATIDEIRGHGFVLTPGRYVGAEDIEDDGEPFEDKIARLVDTLEDQFAESAQLEKAIRQNLQGLGYGG